MFKTMLLKQTEPQFKNWIGKKVSFIGPNNTEFTGNLTFAGINPLHDKFQVTVNNTPIWPVDKNKIKLI